MNLPGEIPVPCSIEAPAPPIEITTNQCVFLKGCKLVIQGDDVNTFGELYHCGIQRRDSEMYLFCCLLIHLAIDAHPVVDHSATRPEG